MMCKVMVNNERDEGRLDSMVYGIKDLCPIKLENGYFIDLSEEKVEKWRNQFGWMTILTGNFYSIF